LENPNQREINNHSSPLCPPKTVAKTITEMNEDKKTTTNKQTNKKDNLI